MALVPSPSQGLRPLRVRLRGPGSSLRAPGRMSQARLRGGRAPGAGRRGCRSGPSAARQRGARGAVDGRRSKGAGRGSQAVAVTWERFARGARAPALTRPASLRPRSMGRAYAHAASKEGTPASGPWLPRQRLGPRAASPDRPGAAERRRHGQGPRPGAALIPTENTGATSQPAGTNSPLGTRYPFEIRDHETLGRGARPKAAADAAAPDGSLDHDHDQASAKAHGRAPLPRGVAATRRSPKLRRFSSSDRARPPRPPDPRISASRPSST